MAMPRKRFAEFAHQAGIAITKLGPFANPATIQVMQTQTSARLSQAISLTGQPVLQIRPANRIGKIIREKRPQGSDELLISPDRLLRFSRRRKSRFWAARMIWPTETSSCLPIRFSASSVTAGSFTKTGSISGALPNMVSNRLIPKLSLPHPLAFRLQLTAGGHNILAARFAHRR